MSSTGAAPVLAVLGQGLTANWYLTRSFGLVAVVLLSATMVLGIVTTVGWRDRSWPRFVSQGLHRNLSLFCLAAVGLHIVTTVIDGYVAIGWLDALVPFHAGYEPLWTGLGALAFDLLVALGLTTAVRRRLGPRPWRAVHWAAYACWPVAMLHGLGSGSDTNWLPAQLLYVLCAAAVLTAVCWRLATGASEARSTSAGRLPGAVTRP